MPRRKAKRAGRVGEPAFLRLWALSSHKFEGGGAGLGDQSRTPGKQAGKSRRPEEASLCPRRESEAERSSNSLVVLPSIPSESLVTTSPIPRHRGDRHLSPV